MSTEDSPFGSLQGTFSTGAPAPSGVNYTHAQEDKLRSLLETLLGQTATGVALLQFAANQRIVTRIIKGKNSSGFIPESRAIFIGIPPELSTPGPETVLALGAYLRQAQLQILGHKNPDESMASFDKAVAFDSKMLDSIVIMCKIAAEHYEKGQPEFVDAILRMGHGELYKSFKEQGSGTHLVDLFYKLYIEAS